LIKYINKKISTPGSITAETRPRTLSADGTDNAPCGNLIRFIAQMQLKALSVQEKLDLGFTPPDNSIEARKS